MKQILLALLVLATLHNVAALPNFDPFADATANGGTSYAIGSGLAPNTNNAGSGWNLVGTNFITTNPQPVIVEGSLSYPDLPASTGNSVSNQPPLLGNGATARMPLNVSPAPSIAYYSFLLKVTDLAAVPAVNANNFIAGFSDGAGAQGQNLARCGGRLVTKLSDSGYLIGIGKGSVVADYVYDSTLRNVNDVVFVVVSYERAGGATNVNLWVNPPSASFGGVSPPAANATVTAGAANGDLNSSGISGFVISCQTILMPSCIIDEVRVATNWGYVTGGTPTYPVEIAAHPASRTVKAGDRVAFVVGASGTDNTYQWRTNGTAIPDGTNAAYAIASAELAHAGSYDVVVTNVINARTSNPAILTVSTTPLQLYETNLIVVRLGDGAQALTNVGNSIFLDQFTTAGAYVNTVFVPDTGSSSLIQSGPELTGSVLTGTQLSRSADKRLLALAGYNVALGNTTPLHNTTSDVVPRGVVTIDSASQIALVLADTNAYSGAHFRGATTDGTNNFWGAGSVGGTYYFGLDSAAAFVQTTFANTRAVDNFNGDLYSLASASGANGLMKFSGFPTTDQGIVPNILTGFNSVNTTDFSVDPTGDLVYVTVGSAVQKWQFDSVAWAHSYSLTLPGNASARYLTVDYSGANPVIYVDNGEGQLFSIVDTGVSSTATTLVTAGPNQLFKGIRFGPMASEAVTQPTLFFTQQAGDLILNWSGAFFLQSATNVAGLYEDVPEATSPYTNSMTSPAQKFFRLRD